MCIRDSINAEYGRRTDVQVGSGKGDVGLTHFQTLARKARTPGPIQLSVGNPRHSHVSGVQPTHANGSSELPSRNDLPTQLLFFANAVQRDTYISHISHTHTYVVMNGKK
eukprot:TRINITY_DN5496_c0_g1_i1.p1 TRINITY_DN5496_c0_g1~~TRINITY_DN5496_c0_g1_i1.p1  ORF type:complete len:117 (+),score=3.50 TRINITY_DN5496_c0_g1_i1:24-353(+)